MLSLQEIANKLNTSDTTIRLFMKSNGIDRRNLHDAVRLQRYKERTPIKFKGNEKAISYALGVFHGDGYLCNYNRCFSLVAKDYAFIKRMKSCLTNLKFKNIRLSKTKQNYYSLELGNANFCDFIGSISFEQLSKNQQIEFINGFFDSEGYIRFVKKDGKIQRVITCCNTNRQLIDDIQNFLASLNISSTTVKFQYTNEKWNTIYRLYILRMESQLKFCKYFTLFGRKQKALKKLKKFIEAKKSVKKDMDEQEDIRDSKPDI
jgi:hypothetical protein